MKILKSILFFLCCFFSVSGFSQGAGNNWYFGNKAGITFNNNGTPSALTNGQMNTGEGCATVSDANGNLLFYTDGITVFNRNHNAMPNGTGLLGHTSAAQSAIIVPKPGSNTHYYIITTPSNTGYTTDTTMRYSEVDMSLDLSRGDIIPGIKNLPLFSPSSEKVTAVKHANGLYYWIIGKEAFSKKYRTYLIDCNGVDTTAVVSNTGITNGGGIGSLVASPDGTHLAAVRNPGIEITRFNKATGVVYDSTNLGTAVGYSVAFSPDGKRLYSTNIFTWTLYQWDMESMPISASQTLIGYTNGAGINLGLPGNYRGGTLQLAPNGKIYVAEYNKPSLGVINYPNISGVGCDFDTNAVSLSGRNCRLGLPNFPSYLFDHTPVFSYSGSCSNQNVTFTINSNTAFLDSVHWNFGDTASGVNNISALDSPMHTFSANGTYNVRLIRYAGCIIDTTVIPITSGVIQDGYANIFESYCHSDTATLTASPDGVNYLWTLPGGGSDTAQTITATTAGTYLLLVSNSLGCADTTSIYVSNTGANTGVWPKQSFSYGSSFAAAQTILADADTNVYINGSYYGTTLFPAPFGMVVDSPRHRKQYIMKFGECPWFFNVPLDYSEASDLAFHKNGNLLISGNSPIIGKFVAQLDKETGTMINYMTLPADYYSNFVGIAVSPTNGSIYVKTGTYTQKSVVYKLDTALNILAVDSFGELAPPSRYARGIALDANDNVYVTVNLTAPDIFVNPVTGASILKYDADLIPQDAVELSTSFDKLADLKMYNDTLYAIGTTATPETRVAKFSTGFTTILSAPVTAYPGFEGTACDVDDSCIYFTMVKTDESEVIVQKRNKYTAASNYISLHNTSAGGFIYCQSVSVSKGIAFVTGKFDEQIDPPSGVLNSPDYMSMFAARLDWQGNSFKTDETENEKSITESVFDAYPFPNPSNGTFWVKLHGINKDESLHLQVWDVRGALVYEIETKVQGSIAELNLNGYQSGVYTLRIGNGENTVYKKLVLTH